ncbi:pseudouridine synthase [Moraxella osloensis]|uniref:Pseudouridine synthase n=1 Tax=Faucicola osloensis TaxID=34062 RepID=A0AAW6T8I1_FAUOS|nr:pseudouridine synthase [Moraxella osloensis]MDI4508953.1 pseudouridine synthase [Moraxella osloensis]
MIQRGMKPSKLYLPHDKLYMGGRLIDYLAAHFSHISLANWQRRFDSGLISLERGEPLKQDSPYLAGQTILYYRQVENEPIIPFEPNILHLDGHLLVVDKPHFLPVTPSGRYVSQTLLAKLRNHPDLQQLAVNDISPLHRLDKDTAGVMLLSVNPSSRACYHALFADRHIHKTYHAIAPTRSDLCYPFHIHSRLERGEPFFLTKTTQGEPNAHTTIELIENNGAFSLYRLTPVTGKKHQLRVHMASLGMPLLNDNFYPTVKTQGSSDFTKPLQLLAKSIAFIDPLTNELRDFNSNLSLN